MPKSILKAFTTDAIAAPPELYHEPHWYACYTRGRAEKRVDELLVQRGIESFLPTLPRVREWSDRKKVVDFPLFPSYVFGRFTLRELHQVLTTPGVATVVRRNGLPAPIRGDEIANIRLFAAALAQTGQLPEPQPFEAGQWVKVKEGPFQDVEGVVIERRGRKRVLVGLRTIGQGMEVDIPSHALQPIRSRS